MAGTEVANENHEKIEFLMTSVFIINRYSDFVNSVLEKINLLIAMNK